MTELAWGPSNAGSVVLDLGADIGALILDTPAELAGREIEISPASDGRGARRTPSTPSGKTLSPRSPPSPCAAARWPAATGRLDLDDRCGVSAARPGVVAGSRRPLPVAVVVAVAGACRHPRSAPRCCCLGRRPANPFAQPGSAPGQPPTTTAANMAHSSWRSAAFRPSCFMAHDGKKIAILAGAAGPPVSWGAVTPPAARAPATLPPRGRASGLLPSVRLALGTAAALGLARFAYGLLVPAMRDELGWSLAKAGTLTTANSLGYLVGAVAAGPLARRLNETATFRLGMGLTAAALAANAATASYPVLLLTRAAAGVSGALVFIAGG